MSPKLDVMDAADGTPRSTNDGLKMLENHKKELTKDSAIALVQLRQEGGIGSERDKRSYGGSDDGKTM